MPKSLPTPYKGPFKYNKTATMIFGAAACGESHVLDVRGWGYLASKMTVEKAEAIQDEFGELVVKLLNEHFVKNK